MSNRSMESITVRCSSEKTREVDGCYANGHAAGLAVAAAAPLPAPRQAGTRFFGPHRPVSLGGAGRENRPRQRHSACRAGDDRQLHHLPEIAGAVLTVRMILPVM